MRASVHEWAPWAARVVLLLVVVVGLVVLGDYGVTTDESLRLMSSREWWAALAEGDVERYVTGTRDQYGVVFDLLGRVAWRIHDVALAGEDPFAARHLLCFAAACLALWGTYRLARRLGPEPLPLLALVFLVLTPRFFGSAFANPKDIPFAAGVVFATWACVRALQEPSRRSTVLLALATGVCSAIRPLGAVFFLAGALCIVAPVAPGGLRGRRVIWGRALHQVLVFLLAAYAVAFALWPVLWVRPPWQLITSSLDMMQHIRGSRSLFFGELHPHDDAPGAYAVVWVVITLPLAHLVLGGFAFIERGRAIVRRRGTFAEAMSWGLVLAWIAVPLVMPLVRRTTLYDTVRQLLFVMPAVAILAAHGALRLIALVRGRVRLALIGMIGVALGEAAWRMISLHPYQSLYFSPMVGGLQGAQGRFDVAHYSETYAAGFAWLAAHAEHPIHVHVVGNGSTTASYYASKHGMKLNTPRFGYFVSEVRQGWETLLPGEVVHTVAREGVPLLEVRRVDALSPATVAYLARLPDRPSRDDEAPPDPSEGGTAWEELHGETGQFEVQEAIESSPGVLLACLLHAPEPVSTRLYLVHYWGMTAWLGGTRIHDVDAVPFHYRASWEFPSLQPLDVELPAGDTWLILDISRIRPDWNVGLYVPSASGVTTVSRR